MNRISNDEKPPFILGEYKLTQAAPSRPNLMGEKWSLKDFKKKFRTVIVRYEDNELEFDMIGLDPSFANAFRRLMLSDVPTMAIEKVYISNNTSIIQDEVLSLRLGLIPLRADPGKFEMKADPAAEGTELDTLEFSLKIKCSNNKDGSKDSLRAEDMYKNNNVYSKHIKWAPMGKQKERVGEAAPIHPDILIAKMRPGHELDLKLVAVKGVGREHAKFSPVATAFYRLLPDIKLLREVEGEAAERLQKCFSPGVISIRREKGRKFAVVNDSRYDTGSRNVFRYEDLKDAVVMTKVREHFIFTVESVGALKPDVIFTESVKILKEKCLSLLEELNQV